jgi:hypothetical protein
MVNNNINYIEIAKLYYKMEDKTLYNLFMERYKNYVDIGEIAFFTLEWDNHKSMQNAFKKLAGIK